MPCITYTQVQYPQSDVQRTPQDALTHPPPSICPRSGVHGGGPGWCHPAERSNGNSGRRGALKRCSLMGANGLMAYVRGSPKVSDLVKPRGERSRVPPGAITAGVWGSARRAGALTAWSGSRACGHGRGRFVGRESRLVAIWVGGVGMRGAVPLSASSCTR